METSIDARHLCAALLLAALLMLMATAQTAEARPPNGFYGVMWDRSATEAPIGQQREQFKLMRRSGVESIRTTFSWEQAQPEAGKPPSFRATDRIVGLAARHGIHVLPVVVYTPFWARAVPTAGGTSPPKRTVDYVRYVEQLVRRYGPRGRFWAEHSRLEAQPIRHWQVWNEQNLARFWWRGENPRHWVREYVRLLNASYVAIKRLDPKATVVLGALGNKSWLGLARLFRGSTKPRFDVAAINLYTARPGNVIRTMKIIQRILRRQGKRRTPLWLTEITWPAAGILPGPPLIPRWYTTTAGSARRVKRLYSLAADHRRRLRLERVYWYTWASPYSGHDPFDYSGLVRWTGHTFLPQPALKAFTAVAR